MGVHTALREHLDEWRAATAEEPPLRKRLSTWPKPVRRWRATAQGPLAGDMA